MKQNIYAVYDHKAAAFLPPFFMPTNGMAIRAFSDCVNDDNHQWNKHPGDYALFRIGEFDDVNGQVEGTGPEPVITALEAKEV